MRRRPVVLANNIRMQRSQHAGTFVIVEGRDDRLFCQRFFDINLCQIIVAENKSNVCETISILEEDKFLGVIGLIDADFDHLEGRISTSSNIVVTDLHDLECILLKSSGLEVLINEYGSQPKLNRFSRDIRETLLTAASPIGYLRLYSERKGLALRFKGIDYGKFINRTSLSTDRDALVKEVKKHSGHKGISDIFLSDGIREIENLGLDPWQICTGTDLLSILSIGLRKLLGSNNANVVGNDRLRQALRVAYRKEDFDKTEMKQAFCDWEAQNMNFKIFSQE